MGWWFLRWLLASVVIGLAVSLFGYAIDSEHIIRLGDRLNTGIMCLGIGRHLYPAVKGAA